MPNKYSMMDPKNLRISFQDEEVPNADVTRRTDSFVHRALSGLIIQLESYVGDHFHPGDAECVQIFNNFIF